MERFGLRKKKQSPPPQQPQPPPSDLASSQQPKVSKDVFDTNANKALDAICKNSNIKSNLLNFTYNLNDGDRGQLINVLNSGTNKSEYDKIKADIQSEIERSRPKENLGRGIGASSFPEPPRPLSPPPPSPLSQPMPAGSPPPAPLSQPLSQLMPEGSTAQGDMAHDVVENAINAARARVTGQQQDLGEGAVPLGRGGGRRRTKNAKYYNKRRRSKRRRSKRRRSNKRRA